MAIQTVKLWRPRRNCVALGAIGSAAEILMRLSKRSRRNLRMARDRKGEHKPDEQGASERPCPPRVNAIVHRQRRAWRLRAFGRRSHPVDPYLRSIGVKPLAASQLPAPKYAGVNYARSESPRQGLNRKNQAPVLRGPRQFEDTENLYTTKRSMPTKTLIWLPLYQEVQLWFLSAV